MKKPVTRLSSLVLVAAAAMAAAAADPATRSAKAARAEDAARAARLAAWSEGLRTNANPRTRAQFRDEVFLPFWRRQTVEPFLAGPEGREPWAPEAVRLMEREIFELWNTSLVDCSGQGDPGGGYAGNPDNARDRSDLIGFVERTRTKDPFLQCLRLAALRERELRGRLPEADGGWATPFYVESHAAQGEFAKLPHGSPARLFAAALDAQAEKAIPGRAAEWIAACGASGEEVRAARRFVDDCLRLGDYYRGALAKSFAEKIGAAGGTVDPWLPAVVSGQIEATIAEKRRRTDARSRTSAAAARPNLERAWELRGDPISAALMIVVSARDGADDPERWLARATQAEPDDLAPYLHYEREVCFPDRQADAAAARAYADACLAAAPAAPLAGYEAVRLRLRLARSGEGGQRAAFADPAVARECEDLCLAAAALPGLGTAARRHVLRTAAALALFRGDLETAARLRRESDPIPRNYVVDECLEDVVRVETILDGIAGTNSAEMIRLERRVAAGDFAAVVREGDALLASGKLGPAETTLAALRADTARVATELSAGRAVPLRFSAGGVFVNGSRTGAGWRASEGWVAERWGGEMSTMGAETTLYGTVPLPRNVELRGTYSWNDPDSQFGRKSQLVRIELEEDEDPEHLPYLARVSMRPWESGGLKLSLDGADYHPGHDQIQPGEYFVRCATNQVDFRIVWRDGGLSVWIDDDPTPFASTVRPAVGRKRPNDRGCRIRFDAYDAFLGGLSVRDPDAPAPDPAADADPAPRPDPRIAAGAELRDPLGVLANARTNAAARTRAAFVRESLVPLVRRELAAPFEAGPEASAPWADEARAFLEDSASLAAYDTLSRRFEWEWEPAVRLVLGKGAADPALRWGCAMGLAAQGRRDEAREQVRALREAVAGGRGTPFLRYLAALADWRVDGRARDEAERLGVAWAESLADRPQDSRAVLHLLRQDLDLARLAPLLEASGADPWLALVARGVALGAPDPGRNGALDFAVRFDESRRRFEEAQALRPGFPEPAFEMLRRWAGRLDGGARASWLRRGLSAECDHIGLLDLYVRFFVAWNAADGVPPPDLAHPRSAFANARQRAFADACLGAGRPDAALPVFGLHLLARSGSPVAGVPAWRVDDVYRRVCEAAAALPGRDVAGWHDLDHARAVAAVYSRERGDPDLRLDTGEPFRHRLHPEGPFWGWPGYTRDFGGTEYVSALGGANIRAVAELERLRRAGDWEGVLARGSALSRDPPGPLDSREAGFLFNLLTAAWARTRACSGEWFAVPFLFHGSDAHWDFINGHGSAKPDGDECRFGDDPNRSVRWKADLPAELECRGVVSFPDDLPADRERRVFVALGAFGAGLRADGDGWVAWIGRLHDRIVGEKPAAERRVDAPTNALPFRVSSSRGVVSLWLGDDLTPVLSTDAYRDELLASPSASRTIRLEAVVRNVVVGALAVRAPLGAAPGEEGPEGALPRFRTVLLPGGVPLELAWCPAGSFEEGFWELERQGWTGENPAPRRTAELTRGFWIARCETTRAQWRAATGEDAPGDGAPDAPVAASWDEAAAFAERLGAIAPQEGLRWALPTETQWERAARAGREGPLDPVALGEAIAPAAGAGPRPAGAARANPWGVWDLCGNAREWCADDYAPRATIDPVRDPPPARLAPGAPKAVRGGAADSAHPAELSPGFRAGRVRELRIPSIGFRVVLEE